MMHACCDHRVYVFIVLESSHTFAHHHLLLFYLFQTIMLLLNQRLKHNAVMQHKYADLMKVPCEAT